MQQLKLSLLILAIFSLSGCGYQGPQIKVCISSPGENLFRCYDSLTNKESTMKIADTENYVCASPSDFKTLLEYCKQIKGGK